jgi:hypothetical protein
MMFYVLYMLNGSAAQWGTHELAALPLNGGYTVDGKIRYACGLKMSGSTAWDHTRIVERPGRCLFIYAN